MDNNNNNNYTSYNAGSAYDNANAAGSAYSSTDATTGGSNYRFDPMTGQPINLSQTPPPVQGANIGKSRLLAGLLGVFLGGLGIHSFYLGHTGKGVIQLILTLCSCGLGALWGFIEGVLILVGTINTDADGVALTD